MKGGVLCICGVNQTQTENTQRQDHVHPEHAQTIFLVIVLRAIQYGGYLHIIYIVLGTLGNAGMIQSILEGE